MKFYQGMAIALYWKKVQGVAMDYKITQQHDRKKNKLEKELEKDLENTVSVMFFCVVTR